MNVASSKQVVDGKGTNGYAPAAAAVAAAIEGCHDIAQASDQLIAVMASYTMLSKSAIPALFKKYCPRVDPLPYLAAASVFPMRATHHVVDKLIDW